MPLPMKTIREMIVGSIDVIIQAERLRDGSRRITKITEVIGTEGDVVITQDLVTYEITGEDETGRLQGQAYRHRHRAPRFLGTRPLLQSGTRTGRRARQGQSMIVADRRFLRMSGAGRRRPSPLPAATSAPQKRVSAVAKPHGAAARRAPRRSRNAAQKRKNVAALLKDIEKNQAASEEETPTLRRRLEQAGFPNATPRTFWIVSRRVWASSRRLSAFSPASRCW